MNKDACMGSNEISGNFIVNCKESIIIALYAKSCSIANIWKQNYTIPVLKNKGNKCDITNYRPITVKRIIPKLFDSILSGTLYKNVKYLKIIQYLRINMVQ